MGGGGGVGMVVGVGVGWVGVGGVLGWGGSRRHSSDSNWIQAGPAQKVPKSAPESLKKH